ncbi:MAG TPA: trypsin-like peptidase domain-containing protein, partial [Acidimicrobiales bacterium]
ALDDDGDGSGPARTSLDTPADDTGDTGSSADPVARVDADEPLARAAAAVLPSVVSITATSARTEGSGSGVVISSDGLVLTNDHVVALAAGRRGELEVRLPDGSTAEATIEGRDPASDLAVIRVEGRDDLTPATFGSSADLQVGESVLAVGSPLGLDGSVTAGIVSAVGRAITLGEDPTGPAAVVSAIQTDAAINPGNSGGALVDADGEVVGINTANASLAQPASGQGGGSIGLGFAIPIDEARDIAEQLIEGGEATHAYLGVASADTEEGVVLVEVVDDGPAAGALEEGDLVTAVDDTRVDDVASFTAAIRAHDPGDEVTVHLVRDGDERSVEVTLGTLPSGS